MILGNLLFFVAEMINIPSISTTAGLHSSGGEHITRNDVCPGKGALLFIEDRFAASNGNLGRGSHAAVGDALLNTAGANGGTNTITTAADNLCSDSQTG